MNVVKQKNIRTNGPLLGRRFLNDGIPAGELNELQKAMQFSVAFKIRNQEYKFEQINCAVCGNNNFESLSHKGRYGLYVSVVICQDCGLVQNSPRMNKEGYHRFYNEEYRKLGCARETPTETFFSQQYGNAQRVYDYLINSGRLAKNPSDYKVLEIGSGAGGLVKFFQDKGFSTKGLDLGVEYLEYGRNKHGVALAIGTIHDLPVHEKYDVIIYRHVLEHVLDLNAELKAIGEHLTDSGVIYIQVPGIRYVYKSYNFLWYLQIAHVYHFTLRTLANLFQRNGFRLIAGTELIEAIFVKDPSINRAAQPVNDYRATRRLLLRNEFFRPILPFYWDVKNLFIRFLKFFRIFSVIKACVHFLRKK